ncbi:hypothetical protein O3M35_006851 [Rhynocoris fuscipes]|uniref:Cytochrome c oxidase polypeptide VIIc n=1 Tax=Rhynocoris fuscipes TaxID=488301 RepID=A0AAW1DF81_9HEMI
MLATRITNIVRKIGTSAPRNSLPGGHIGENLPIKLGSPLRITAVFAIALGIGFTAPIIFLRYQLWKSQL